MLPEAVCGKKSNSTRFRLRFNNYKSCYILETILTRQFQMIPSMNTLKINAIMEWVKINNSCVGGRQEGVECFRKDTNQ